MDQQVVENKQVRQIYQDDYYSSKLAELKNAYLEKGKITEEEMSAVKILFKDIIGYNQKSHSTSSDNNIKVQNFFTSSLQAISFQEYQKEELIIDKDEKLVHMYVIINGRIKISAFKPSEVHKELFERNQFDIISQQSLFKSLQQGQIFGDYSLMFPDKKWKSFYAYPEEESAQLLKIDYNQIKSIFDRIQQQQKQQELLLFLNESVPGFKFRTTSHKDRMSKCFEVKVFTAGHALIKEGEKSDYAYIL